MTDTAATVPPAPAAPGLTAEEFLTTVRPLRISGPIVLPERNAGKPVYVRELNGLEAAALERLRYPVGADGVMRLDIGNESINWTLFSLCDAAGRRLLTEENRAAVAMLPGPELDRIAAEAQRINAPSQTPVGDAAKN